MEDMEEKKGETVVDNTDSVPVNGQVQTPTKRDQLISLLTEEIPGYNADDDESSAEMLMGYINGNKWKIQCKLPPKTKRFCPLVLK